jgi:hypothetical protein
MTKELSPIEQKLLEIKSLPDIERLQELNWLAEEVANEFTWQMSFIDAACDDAIAECSDEAKEYHGWHDAADITRDIDVTLSYGW